jgi:hypothetical protein
MSNRAPPPRLIDCLSVFSRFLPFLRPVVNGQGQQLHHSATAPAAVASVASQDRMARHPCPSAGARDRPSLPRARPSFHSPRSPSPLPLSLSSPSAATAAGAAQRTPTTSTLPPEHPSHTNGHMAVSNVLSLCLRSFRAFLVSVSRGRPFHARRSAAAAAPRKGSGRGHSKKKENREETRETMGAGNARGGKGGWGGRGDHCAFRVPCAPERGGERHTQLVAIHRSAYCAA